MRRCAGVLMLLAMGMSALCGCGSRRVTDTPRTATEQLLVSAAVDQAVDQLDFAPLAERKVFIDASLVERLDKTFVVASVRFRAWSEGAILVPELDEAHYVLELRCGAVGVNRNEYIFGIPETIIPAPGGSIAIPEAPLYKSVKQAGGTRISFVVYTRQDRRFFYASGPAYGFSNEQAKWLFGAGPAIDDNIKPARDQQNTARVPEPLSVSVPPPPPQPAVPAEEPTRWSTGEANDAADRQTNEPAKE